MPGLLVENLDMVAARMGMGLFVDCARVGWSLNAFKTVSTLTSSLVLSSANGSGHNVDVAKVRCKLGKEVEDTLKEGVYVPMK